MFDPFEKIEKITLQNGIIIHLCPWSTDFIHMTAGISSGHLDNPVGLEGTAHLAEHVAAVVCNFNKHKKIANLLGVDYSLGSTNDTATWISMTIPTYNQKGAKTTAYLHKALGTIDDYFFKIENKRLKAIFQKEKTAVINECFFRNDSPESAKKYRNIFHEPWGELNHMRQEYPETIEKIRLNDVINFIKKHYTTNNLKIVISGDFDREVLVRKLLDSPLNQRTTTGKSKIKKDKLVINSPEVFHVNISAPDFGAVDMGQGVISMLAITNSFSWESLAIARNALSKNLLEEIRKKLNLSYAIPVKIIDCSMIYEFQLVSRMPVNHLEEIESIIEEQIINCANNLGGLLEAKKIITANWRLNSYEIIKTTKAIFVAVCTEGRPIPDRETRQKYIDASIEEASEFLKYFAEKRNRFTLVTYP